MLDKSRFNRRLHKVGKLLYELFEIVSSYFKDFCCEMHYIIDSFPVAVCNNMRIVNCKIVTDKKWRGYTASMRSYFYGVKVQLLTTKDGIIKKKFPRTIHAVTLEGFLIKLTLFVFGLQLNKAIN